MNTWLRPEGQDERKAGAYIGYSGLATILALTKTPIAPACRRQVRVDRPVGRPYPKREGVSMHCTDVERPKAKKPHRCMSCGEGITVGETYVRWRCYDGGDASTNKMHPECLEMHQADAEKYGDREWEYSPYSHERPKD